MSSLCKASMLFLKWIYTSMQCIIIFEYKKVFIFPCHVRSNVHESHTKIFKIIKHNSKSSCNAELHHCGSKASSQYLRALEGIWHLAFTVADFKATNWAQKRPNSWRMNWRQLEAIQAIGHSPHMHKHQNTLTDTHTNTH